LRERIKVRGWFNYEENHPPLSPLPSREGRSARLLLMLASFKFDIKDVSKSLLESISERR